MRETVIRTILVAALLSAPAFAQRVEIFGGAQFEHLQSAYNAAGWNASLTGNFKHFLGITGDFSVFTIHTAQSRPFIPTQLGPYSPLACLWFSPLCTPCSVASLLQVQAPATMHLPCSLAGA